MVKLFLAAGMIWMFFKPLDPPKRVYRPPYPRWWEL